jgi:hypothetical protein
VIDLAPARFVHAARRLCLALLLASAALAGSVHGQTLAGPSPIAWTTLSPAQRAVLTPLERDWKTIPPAQQQKWAELAKRFRTLPADEQGRVQQRIVEWSRLTPQQRASARLNFQEARQLSPQERQLQWDAYRALSADQRRALAERADPPRAATSAPRSPDTGVKSSVVKAPAPAQAHPVGPTVVQRGSGATTNLVSKPTTPPLHQQTGLPKVAATPGFVDSDTLLPKRGAQGAAAARSVVDDSDKIKAQ